MSDITNSKKCEYIADKISHDIKAGCFGESGQRFISVRRLAKEKNISLVTAQKVLNILKARGIVQIFGSSSYITKGRISKDSPLYKALMENSFNTNRLIGIHVPKIDNPFFDAFLQKSVSAIYSKGYSPIIMCSNKNPEIEKQILSDFISLGVSGVISYSNDDGSLTEVYKNYILPIIYDEHKASVIATKNKTISKRIADYLIEMGYEYFMYIGLDAPDDVRRTAYIHELSSRGISADVLFLKDDAEYSIPYYVEQKIKNAKKPLGIFCYHDLIATQILLCCNRLEIKVPQEVGIVGFDNWSITKQLKPTLTTVSYSFKKLADSTVDRLIYSIENDKDIAPDINDSMDYILHMRQSTKRK